jgi:lipopolysaccharide export system protein LptA
MKSTSTTILVAATSLAALLGASSIFAQQADKKDTGKQGAVPATQMPNDKPPKPEKDTVWDFEGVDLEHNDATGQGSGKNVTAVSSDGSIIKADIWKWNDKKKTAEGTGNLSLTDPEADATSDKADIFYHKAKKLMVLTGNVHLTLKPKDKKSDTPMQPMPVDVQGGKAQVQPSKPSDDGRGETKRTPVLVTCDKLEYEYAKDKKHATLTGNLTTVQKLKDVTRTITAGRAETFGTKDEIVLHPPVHGTDTKGRIFDSKDSIVTIFTKEGDERIVGAKMTFRVPVTDDDDEPAAKPPAKPAKTP